MQNWTAILSACTMHQPPEPNHYALTNLLRGFLPSVPCWCHALWCRPCGATANRGTASQCWSTMKQTNPAPCHGDEQHGKFAETMLTFEHLHCSRASKRSTFSDKLLQVADNVCLCQGNCLAYFSAVLELFDLLPLRGRRSPTSGRQRFLHRPGCCRCKSL